MSMEAKRGGVDSAQGTAGNALLAHLADGLGSVREDEFRPVSELLVGFLEIARAGEPEFSAFSDVREDAKWWADVATPIELEAYVGEGLRRIERTSFAPMARKRLMVALWDSFSAEDQRRFLARVNPGGEK